MFYCHSKWRRIHNTAPGAAVALMSSHAQHRADCGRDLGEPFKQVHEWLDELFKALRQKQRSARHHAGGVEQVRRMWGDRAARAAEIHIMRDCGGIVPSEKDAQMVSMFGAKGVR